MQVSEKTICHYGKYPALQKIAEIKSLTKAAGLEPNVKYTIHDDFAIMIVATDKLP